MSERDVDTDIDFDFFEEEPATEETSQADRIIRRPGPRGPRRPPRTPANLTPLLRLVGLIAFAILIIVLLVFWIQSCRESGKKATYRNYMEKVSEVASSSQQIGRQLNQALTTPGIKQAALEKQIRGLATQEQRDVDRARGITPPGTLRDEHLAVIEALQFRVSGLTGLADALGATAKKNVNQAAPLVAAQVQRLLASDVVWDDEFKDPAQGVVRRQGVTGTGAGGGPLVPDSNFLQSAELAATTAIVPVLQRLRGTVTVQPGTIRGTNIVSTKVQPSGKELSTGTQTPITVTVDMAFEVAVEDSGDSQEVQIPVTLTIEQSGSTPITRKAKIAFINPKETKTVTFGNIPALVFSKPATIKVEVQPVPNEHTTSNNSADYPVIFSA